MAELNDQATANDKSAVKTKKYICVNDCYFQSVVYNEGDTVEFPVSVKVPSHFEEVK